MLHRFARGDAAIADGPHPVEALRSSLARLRQRRVTLMSLRELVNRIQAGEALADAPDLKQPVFAAIHIRHRTLPLHRRLTQLVARHFRQYA